MKVCVQMKNNKRPNVPYKEYILSLLAVAVISGGGVYSLTKQNDQDLVAFKNSYPNFTDLEKINQTYQTIQDNYVGKVDEQALVDGAISGMTKALDDPYSDYYVGEPSSDLNDNISGSFEGIGAIMMIKDDQVTIAEPPLKNSPAAKAKLKVGDQILKVDKKAVKGKTLAEVVKSIKGKAGSTVTLEMSRDGDIFTVQLKREKIETETVSGEMNVENKNIGVITIHTFSEHTVDEFKKTIKSLRKEGAKKFILDVRENPGGLLDQAAQMSSMFLKDNEIIVKFEDKNEHQQQLKASFELDQGFKVTEPSVVLIDGDSASASEIFAAALNQSADVPLIGEKSFGKGTVQTVQSLSKDSDLKLTTSKWLTPKGEWIHGKGIKPTISVSHKEYENLLLIDDNQDYQLGMKGKSLKNINQILSVLKYDVNADSSTFDEKTAKAVIKLQEKSNIEATGIINNETAKKMMTLVAKDIANNDKTMSAALKELRGKESK